MSFDILSTRLCFQGTHLPKAKRAPCVKDELEILGIPENRKEYISDLVHLIQELKAQVELKLELHLQRTRIIEASTQMEIQDISALLTKEQGTQVHFLDCKQQVRSPSAEVLPERNN